MPLTVHYLGAERYGVWLTISSLLTWMSMTDFGLAGNALVNVLAEASGKDDQSGGAALHRVGILGAYRGERDLRDHLRGVLSLYTLAGSVSGLRGNLDPRAADGMRADAAVFCAGLSAEHSVFDLQRLPGWISGQCLGHRRERA